MRGENNKIVEEGKKVKKKSLLSLTILYISFKSLCI